MTLRSRVQTMERDVELLIDDTLSPEARSESFGRAARKLISSQDDVNDAHLGRDVQYTTYVDGRETPLLETAKRVVVAEWDLLETVFQDILDLLLEEAPVLTGAYASSITLFADGIPVAPSLVAGVPEASEYYFAATVPYARKIERGQSRWAPDGVFQGVAALAQKRFGNIARVRYGFRSIRGGAIGAWAATTRLQARSRSLNVAGPRRQEWLTRQPAIVVRPR